MTGYLIALKYLFLCVKHLIFIGLFLYYIYIIGLLLYVFYIFIHIKVRLI